MTQQWQQHPAWGRGPALELVGLDEPCERLVVVSAHPDDESLGVGGIIALAHEAGIAVYVVLLTAGEASHPPAEHTSRHALATRRLTELDAAIDLLAPGSPVVFLGAPDTGVAEVEDEVVAALTEIVGDGASTVLLAPWRHDGHPDHEAAGRAAARVAASCRARLLEYPLLMWHHLDPAEAPWSQMATVQLDPATLATKLAAIRAHASQIRTTDEGRPALEGVRLRHFAAPVEHVIAQSQSQSQSPVPRPREAEARETVAVRRA